MGDDEVLAVLGMTLLMQETAITFSMAAGAMIFSTPKTGTTHFTGGIEMARINTGAGDNFADGGAGNNTIALFREPTILGSWRWSEFIRGQATTSCHGGDGFDKLIGEQGTDLLQW